LFNVFESTHRFRGKTAKVSSAGTAKVATVTARSKSELKELGERLGWTPGPRTMAEINAMSSQQCLWEENFNSEQYERALSLPGITKERKDIDHQRAAKKLWDDQTQPTPEQAAEIWKALENFKETYPQLIPARRENECILLWLKDRNMHVTFSNLVESFEANALEGRLYLNPNAISAGSETEVSGQQLLQHHNFFKLIQPQKRISDVDRLSADEFFEKNKETLADRRTPPIIVARNAQQQATEKFFEQAKEATATPRTGATRVTDFGHEPRGGSGTASISEIEKASLRNLVKKNERG